MPADALATLGTRASAGIVLTPKVGIFCHRTGDKPLSEPMMADITNVYIHVFVNRPQ